MGNCLKTQLKESVNNSNLEVLGKATIEVNPIASSEFVDYYARLECTNSKACNVSAKDGAYFAMTFADLSSESSRLTSYDFPAGGFIIYVGNVAGKLFIDEKYTISSLQLGRNDVAESPLFTLRNYLDYNDVLLNLKGYMSGEIKSINSGFEKLRVSGLSAQNKSISGNIESINCPNLTVFKISNSDVVFNISNLNTPQLINFDALNSDNIKGEIKDFVNLQVISGRTTNSSMKFIRSAGFTLNGVSLPSASNGSLMWEGISKIVIGIDRDTISASTFIYTYGYTQAEAEEAFPGKTITRTDA